MTKRMMVALIVGITVIFAATAIYAGTEVKDVIEMNTPQYAKHTKGIVKFSHKKHVAEYKANCGDCHHDKDGKPLAQLKEGDEVQKCIECHKNTGKKPKGKLSKKQKLEYHAEAIHMNCKDCHKKFNKKNKTKAAPTTCAKCHPKTK